MKETELRINNWFYHKGKHWSYRNEGASNGFEFQWDSRDWYALGECKLSLEDIEPIPLTEEWLLKFENVRINSYGEVIVYNENSNGFEIVIFEFKHGNLYYTAGEGATLSPPIEFLHQFQNYVYLLSGGNELKLKQ